MTREPPVDIALNSQERKFLQLFSLLQPSVQGAMVALVSGMAAIELPPVSSAALSFDITQLVLEQELPVFVTDKAGHIVRVNPAFSDYFGFADAGKDPLQFSALQLMPEFSVPCVCATTDVERLCGAMRTRKLTGQHVFSGKALTFHLSVHFAVANNTDDIFAIVFPVEA